MNDIYGVPMASIMAVLLVLLSLCLLSVAWVAWRRPVIFKLGVRNIPRRRAGATLIIVGLMLSTMIISAALGTGDTLAHSMSADIYDNLGPVDELIVPSQDGQAKVDLTSDFPFDVGTFAAVEAAATGDANVDGLLPLLDAHAPVSNSASRLAEPDALLTGLDPVRLATFGGLHSLDGDAIDLAGLPANGVVLSETLATNLGAKVGDQISIYVGGQPVEHTVAAIAEDSFLSGLRRSRSTDLETAGMAMSLASLQQLTSQPGQISAIAVSNAGGVRDGVDATDEVVGGLRAALADQGFGIDPIKQDRVDRGESLATVFTTVFLVLGLFAIATGVLLILLIFTLLAAERRYEMGVTRAVGAQRGQLVQQFVAEGAGYALLSGLVGAALGVATAGGIAAAMSALFGQFVPIVAHVTPRSLIVAYCLGVVLTFAAVVASSWKISRLNVVAAVRDLPDFVPAKRNRGLLAWSTLLALLGGLLMWSGERAGEVVPFYLGLSLLPFGAALLARFFGAPGRPTPVRIGLAILALWLLPTSVAERLFGSLHRGVELFFVSGILMAVATTIIIVQNTDVLLASVTKLGGIFRSKLPAVRTAVAYPGMARGRTGMTIAMFSLIVFSLVMIATISKNVDNLLLGDEADGGWDVRADTLSANPIVDFSAELRANGIDTASFTAVGKTTMPNPDASQLRVSGTSAWKRWSLVGMDDAFINREGLTFQDRAEGYATDADVLKALATEPNVAVIDANVLPGGAAEGDAFTLIGFASAGTTFTPITVEIADPQGTAHPVTIIGIIDSKLPTFLGLHANQRTIDAIAPQPALTSYYIGLNDPDRADRVAKEIEAALLRNGVQGTSIRDELKESQRQATGFLYLIQGFMGLGLLVGMAAVGVVAFRAVVERRQQIGMLRAIGYQRGMVALSFLIETAFVVGLGVLSGAVLGIVLARNLFMSDAVAASTAGASFTVPVPLITIILVTTMTMALLMTWIPSGQASRVAPAEALRYE